MPALSPFQCLPEHVAEVIAHYYCDLRRYRPMFIMSEETEEPWFVLRDVSFSWMALAFKHIYKEARLVLSSDESKNTLVFTHIWNKAEGRAKLLPYAKTVNIMFEDMFDHSDQEKVDALSSSWPVEYVFPQALILTVNVKYDSSRPNKSHSATEDTHYQWLAQRIRASFPKLQELRVFSRPYEHHTIGPESIYSIEWNMGLFLAAFHRQLREKDMSESSFLTNSNLLRQSAPQFTLILLSTLDIDSGTLQHLIKQSAATLESLVIFHRELRFMEGCIYRDDGRPMTYPRLKKLEICPNFSNHEIRPADLRGTEMGVLFPALWKIKLYSGRIFDDYALFKSCRNTLKSLDITLNSEIVNLLRRSNPFWSDKGSQLSQIILRPGHDIRSGMSATDFLRFAFGLCTPATRALSLIANIPHRSIMRVIPTYPCAKDLQIFDIRECKLSILQMFSVIQLFPSLSDFSCGFAGIDTELSRWHGLALPDYFRRRCYPLSRHLKCWHTYPDEPAPTKDLALTAITLATVCPKFTFAQLQVRGDSENMFYELCAFIERNLYGEYMETVKKLFYF